MITTHYMDEAERCHKLAYISYGKLLTTGTPEEVVNGVGLTTWEVEGPDLAALEEQLKGLPGIEHIVPFGLALHVSGKDEVLLTKSIQRAVKPPFEARAIPANLEDAFIHLMAGQEGKS